MRDIITIAESTFYRMARTKSLYFILAICVADVWAMSRYGEISLGMERELMKDCALALCLIVGVLTSLTASFEIPRELRERTASMILSKPGGRTHFLWGKFFGLGALCILNVGVVGLGSVAVYRLEFGEAPWALLGGAALIAAESLVLVGVGLALSINLSDTTAAVVQFLVFVAGHALYMLPRVFDHVAVNGITYILPNFYNLDLKTEISHGVEIPEKLLAYGLLYGLAYALAAVGVANLLFYKKDVA